MDYAILRNRMVDEQLIPRDIKDKRVLEAFRKVERHKFLPDELRTSAYADYPIPIGEGQTISQPYIVALMTELLQLKGNEKVLEVGTGSGYQTAILAELSKEVYSVERFETLHNSAGKTLADLGYKNIRLKIDDGTLGWREFAPFDRIIVTAASPRLPLPLEGQIKEGGRIVLPIGESFSQVLTLAEKKSGKIETTAVCGCVFVPMVGKYAWKE